MLLFLLGLHNRIIAVCKMPKQPRRESRPPYFEFFITNWHVAGHYRFNQSLVHSKNRYITGF